MNNLGSKLNVYLTAALLFFLPLVFSHFTNLAFELPKVTFFRSLILLGLFLAGIDLLKTGKLSLPEWKKYYFIYLLSGLFLGTVLISTVTSIAPSLSFFGSYYRLQGFITLFPLVLFFWLLLINEEIKSKKEFLLKVAVVSGFLVSLYGLGQKIGLIPWMSGQKEVFLGRIPSTLGHPNFLGQFLIVTIFITLGLLLQEKKKYSYLIALISQFLALFFTLNRASFLGLGVGLIVLLLIYAKVKYPPLWKGAWIGFLTVLILVLTINLAKDQPLIKENKVLNRMVLAGENLRSIQSRLYIWPVALKIIKEHPFLGSGPETFSLLFPKYQPKELLALEVYQETGDRAHNEILDLLINFGLGGFILYYGLIISILVLSWKHFFKEKTDRPLIGTLIAALIAQLVANQFGFPTIVHLVYTWFLLAFIIILISEKRDFKEIKILSITQKKIVLIVGGIVMAGLIFINIQTLQADKAFKRAENYFNAGNATGSIQEYETAIKRNPWQSFYNFYFSHAALTLAKNQPDLSSQYLALAEEAAQKGEKFSNQQDFNAYLLLGNIWSYQAEISADQMKNDLMQKALLAFQKGLDLAPNNPLLYKSLALSFFKWGDFANSITTFEKLLAISPPYWQWNLAEKSLEDKNKARIFFKLNPDLKKIFFIWLALILL